MLPHLLRGSHPFGHPAAPRSLGDEKPPAPASASDGRFCHMCAPETIRTSDTFFRREVLYPLSYEGVPIQYKAPRTAGRHSPPKPPASTGSRTAPFLCPNPCSPPEDTRSRQQNHSYNVRMSIYIDPPTWPAHGTVFSHLISDVSLTELHEFAAAAGISERAFDRDHYDVPAHLYEDLVRAGAKELSGAELTRTLIASGLRIPLKERPEKIRPRLLRAWKAAFAPRLARLEVSSELRAQVAELGESLLQAWEQPHRAYHHSGHLSQMLTDLDRLYAHRAQAGSTPLALILAAWFHDAVYEGAPGEDERRSEQLAVTSLEPLVTAGLLTEHELQMVRLLVRATATHELPEPADQPAGYEPADIELFLDADMAILAADSARYRRYLRGVRSEYSHFDDEAFRAGRTTFLRSILGRERIFLSEQALKLWEEPAQANLRAELNEWEQDPQGLLHALAS